jgi:hypothetical protein
VDHLVVLAADLASGAAWCERTLGVAPAAGGEHPLMGTHNRLMNISGPAHPRAYLEIIAINSGATSTISTSDRRWFDMDSEALQAQVALHGPQLIHWVAAVPDAAAAHMRLAAQGLERGNLLVASRATPQGLLQWRITVRPDGQRLMDGCLPTLIEWGDHHPCDTLPASGVTLQALALQHPNAAVLGAACQALGLGKIAVQSAPQARITATLTTPRGPLTLLS